MDLDDPLDDPVKIEAWDKDSREFNDERIRLSYTVDPNRPCKICGCTRIRTITQEQIRSLDEPMTVFVACAHCEPID